MLSATNPTSATMTRIAAALSTSPVADNDEQSSEAAEDEKRGGERSSGVRAEPEADEERGAEHHDSECHGARVGPSSDGPDRVRDRHTQGAVATSRFRSRDASPQVGPADARGRCRGPCRVRGVHAPGACGRSVLHVLQHVGLRRPDGARVRHRRIARVPRRERSSRLDRDHGRARLLDLRRAVVRDLQARDLSVDGRPRATSPSTRCCTSASSCCSAPARGRSAARSGSTESRRR